MGTAVQTRTFDPAALRQRRQARGLSQTKLAAQIGLNSRALSLFENGHCGPSVTTLAAIADALGASMDDFMTRADREEVSA